MTVASPRLSYEERSALTRTALIGASIATINRLGYAGATTAIIAKKAGMTRGAFLHHFSNRATLMAEVVRHVFDQEMAEYEQVREVSGLGNHLSDWPKILWEVLARPSGLAVLEILQATRSDPELAAAVLPMQEQVESAALASIRNTFGGDERSARALMRLMVWTARGLSIAESFIPAQPDTTDAVNMLSSLLRIASPGGTLVELTRSLSQADRPMANAGPA